jgi:hypothetical protein
MIIIANMSAERRHIDIGAEIVERHLPGHQQRDDREQCDTRAIDLQPGDTAGRHAEISQNQDQQNDSGVHRGLLQGAAAIMTEASGKMPELV